MVYGEFLRNIESYRNVLSEEFGILDGRLSERLVVSPLPLERFLNGLEEFLDAKGIEFEWLHPNDPVIGLSKVA